MTWRPILRYRTHVRCATQEDVDFVHHRHAAGRECRHRRGQRRRLSHRANSARREDPSPLSTESLGRLCRFSQYAHQPSKLREEDRVGAIPEVGEALEGALHHRVVKVARWRPPHRSSARSRPRGGRAWRRDRACSMATRSRRLGGRSGASRCSAHARELRSTSQPPGRHFQDSNVERNGTGPHPVNRSRLLVEGRSVPCYSAKGVTYLEERVVSCHVRIARQHFLRDCN